MTRLPNANSVARLKERMQDMFFGDTAAVLQDTVTSLDSYGQPNVTTVTTAIDCSFTDKPNPEVWKNFADITEVSAEIRYTGAPVPVKGNRITLKGRFDGTSYVDQTFEIIDIQDRDVFGYVCALKKVEI